MPLKVAGLKFPRVQNPSTERCGEVKLVVMRDAVFLGRNFYVLFLSLCKHNNLNLIINKPIVMVVRGSSLQGRL